ncbi:hypothetical protein VQ042_24830 [Aurantimonas sp. A2-1-M11]|uniref:phenylacetate--CoA ligase family protein n=1 Tax=Aurantimonas sp. A2-1-M11 TaxID=3113712 RepID=UPI002F951D4F
MKNRFFELKYRAARPRARNTLAHLVDIDSISARELWAIQQERRGLMVAYAYEFCPYYREKYNKAGFRQKDISEDSNFFELPTLTRDEVKSNFSGIMSSEYSSRHIELSSTGGSTGVPIVVGVDPDHAVEVVSWRRLRAWGVSPADNSGYIYRVVPKGKSELLRRLLYYPTRRTYLSATEMSEKNMSRFVRHMIDTRARYIVAYVGALKILADYLKSNNISLPNLKFIWSTAAPLPVYLRYELEDVFGVPVYSQYGCSEFYWIAAERVDRTGLDIDWDIRTVEILDDRKRVAPIGEFGDIAITDLLNRAFPLIRYEVGDRSRLLASSLPLGDQLPILDFVKGRTSDTIVLKNGRRVPGEFWTTIFDSYVEAINGFHVHQRSDHTLEVGFIPNEHWTRRHEEEILKTLEEVCEGTPIVLSTEGSLVNDRGKLKFVTSDLS